MSEATSSLKHWGWLRLALESTAEAGDKEAFDALAYMAEQQLGKDGERMAFRAAKKHGRRIRAGKCGEVELS